MRTLPSCGPEGAEVAPVAEPLPYEELFGRVDEGIAVLAAVPATAGAAVDFRFQAANPAFTALTGLADVVGRTMRELLPELEPHWYEIFGEVAGHGRPARFQEYARTLGRWYDVYAFRLGGAASGRMVVYLRDISGRPAAAADDLTSDGGRQGARARPPDSESFADKILASSLNGLYIYDFDIHRNVFINPQYTVLTGFDMATIEAMAPDTFAALFHPDDREAVAAHMAAVCRSRDGEALEIDYRFRRRDGRWIWCRSRDTVFSRRADGSVARLVGAFVDATARMEAEAALRASREELNRAQAVAHVGSWRLDGAAGRLLWSDENWRIFGVPVGRPLDYGDFLSIVHPDERNWVDRKWTAAMRGEEPYDIEHRIMADGRVKWVRERAELSFDEHGRFRGALGTTQDITERKAAEEEIRALNRGLERRVEQRTAALRASEERLRRLTAQLATAQDAEQQRIAEALHDDVAQILAACSLKLATVANPADAGLADVAALLDEANEKVRLMSFELGSGTLYRLGLVKALEELADSMAERYGLRVAVSSEGDTGGIDEATGVVLYKAARELLFNVAKHAGTKEASVTVRALPDSLRLVVEDAGVGFASIPTLEEGSLGRGLGLFGIWQRLDDLGGTMQIDSRAGEHTRIELTVPTLDTT